MNRKEMRNAQKPTGIMAKKRYNAEGWPKTKKYFINYNILYDIIVSNSQ